MKKTTMKFVILLSALCAVSRGEGLHTIENSLKDFPASLNGVWYNELGSMMVLNQSDTGVLTGEYKTAVEKTKGASNGEQLIHGRVGTGNTRTFGFTVTFNGGESTTAWSGQYQICDGKETLLTTWILTTHTDSCSDHWFATRIGQDKFTRDGSYVKVTGSKDKKKKIKKIKIKTLKKIKKAKRGKKNGGNNL